MILVTGASGLVGRAVAQHFALQGHKVRLQGRDKDAVRDAVSHPTVDSSLFSIEAVDFGSASSNDFQRLTVGCQSVIHCAGLVHRPSAPADEYRVLNENSTRLLAEAAANNGARSFTFLSTSAVYGDGPFELVAEADPKNPATPYAQSKLNSENWLQSLRLFPRLVILRPSLVFGEGDRGNMAALLRQIRKKRYVHIAGNRATKSVIYSRNLAHMIALCEALPEASYVFNATEQVPISVIELADKLAQSASCSAPLAVPRTLLAVGAIIAEAVLGERSPLTRQKLEKLTATTSCAATAVADATGYKPLYSLEEAIKNELRWLDGQPAVIDPSSYSSQIKLERAASI